MRSTILGATILLFFSNMLFSIDVNAQAVDRSMQVEPSRFMINHYSTKDGLPGNYTSVVYPSSSGYVWSASKNGLSRFDGERINTYNASNTKGWIHSNNVTQICEDETGAIWFDTGDEQGKGLYVFRYPFEPQEVQLYEQSIYKQHLCLANKEIVVFADSTFQIAQDIKEIKQYDLPAAFINDKAFHVHATHNGGFWLAGHGKLLHYQDGVLQQALVMNDTVIAMEVNKAGELLVATSHDVFVVRNDTLELLVHSEEALSPLNINHSSALWFNQPGEVWTINGSVVAKHQHPTNKSEEFLLRNVFELEDRIFATWMIADFESRSFELVEGDRWKSLGLEQHDVKAINAISQDSEGGVWFASDVGILHVVPRKVDAYTTREGIADSQVFALGEDKAGDIWVSAWGDGIQVLRNQQWTYFSEDDGLLYNHVMSFEQLDDGRWLAGTNKGLNIMRGDRIIESYRYEWPNTYTPDLLQDSNGQVWVATHRNLYAFDEGIYTPVWPDSILQVKVIFEDKDGQLWAGTEYGVVARNSDGVWERLGMPVLDAEYTKNIMQDVEGDMWFSTDGAGLIRKADNKYTQYGSAQGLPTNLLHYSLEDGLGNLWLGTDSGLLRISRANFDSLDAGLIDQLRYQIFTEEDGMPSAELISGPSSALRARDGRLWVATIGGVAVIDPANLVFNTKKPDLRLQKFIVQGESQPLVEGQRFKPGAQNTVLFEFATLSLRTSRRRQYRYRLLGQNDDWRSTPINEAKFTSLKPGTYTFEVAGSNNDGYWSDVEQFMFVIAPVYHQSIWFRGVLIGLFAGIIGLGYRQVKINGALQEALTRNRIADDLHDDIGSKISAIAQTLGYIYEKEELSPRDFQALGRQAKNATELVQDLRDSVWIVDAENDKICDLIDRMEQFTHQIGLNHQVAFFREVDTCKTEIEMEWRRNVYLLYKEAVTNIVRHAQATEIVTQVMVTERAFVMVLRDDGIGFNRSAGGSGRGRQSMTRRAKAIKGSLTFSGNGKGTVVRLDARIA